MNNVIRKTTALTATKEVQSLTNVDPQATTEKDEVCALGSHLPFEALIGSQGARIHGQRGLGSFRGRGECREYAII